MKTLEIRFRINDIIHFTDLLQSLGADIEYNFQSKDIYYQPKKSPKWNPNNKTLRIRKWESDNTSFTRVYMSVHRLTQREGYILKSPQMGKDKFSIFSGSLKECKDFLEELGFVEWVTLVRKTSKLWNLQDYSFKTTTEYFENLGWWGELEFVITDREGVPKSEISRRLGILKLDKNLVTGLPMVEIYNKYRK